MFLVLCLLIFIASNISNLNLSLFPEKDFEVIRETSPDGKLDAVMIIRDRGAMGTATYLAYIIPCTQKITKKDVAVFKATKMFDKQFSWKEDQELLIHYSQATILHSQDYVYPMREDPDYRVVIELLGDK